MENEPPPAYSYNTSNIPAPGHNEPPPGYSQSSVVVVSQPLYPACQVFQEHPVRTTCPSCRADILTSIHYEAGSFTWIACLFMAFFGLWLFCCLIPFCLNACKDAVHTCPNCRHTVGRYNRAGA